MSSRLAVSVMPLENRRETLIDIGTTADRLGYDAFFLPETRALDTTVILAELSMRTQQIHLASGVLSVWSRSPGALAMAASTLHSLSGGRIILGLGASTAELT